MDSFQIEPLNLTRIKSVESVKSTKDLCIDCNSEYCIVKQFQAYQKERFVLNQRYECMLCRKSYSTLSTLRKHQSTHTEKKSFYCALCSKFFTVEYALQKHLIQHTKEKPFECGLCAKRFLRQSSLSAHKRLHKSAERDFQCNFCGKQFRWKSNLSAHLAMHRIQMFTCAICQKTFDSTERLQEHQRKHANPEHQCRYCEKVFSNRYKVNYHIRFKHQNIARWQCQFCSESFSTATKFRSHIYEIHDTPKPFACNICNCTFRTKHNLNLHNVKHKKCDRFECDICGHQFVHKRNLYSHMMRHYENKELNSKNSRAKQSAQYFGNEGIQYFCKQCNRNFANQKAALNCTHNANHLQKQMNNGLNGTNIETNGQQNKTDGMKVKISLVAENRLNQIIPLYELNIPTVAPIDSSNMKSTLENEHRNIDPIILVQAFTTPLNSTNNNYIDGNASVKLPKPKDSFKVYCKSLVPEIIVIDDSSSDDEMFAKNSREKSK